MERVWAVDVSRYNKAIDMKQETALLLPKVKLNPLVSMPNQEQYHAHRSRNQQLIQETGDAFVPKNIDDNLESRTYLMKYHHKIYPSCESCPKLCPNFPEDERKLSQKILLKMQPAVLVQEYVNAKEEENGDDWLTLGKKANRRNPVPLPSSLHLAPIIIPSSSGIASDAESDCESISIRTFDFCNIQLNTLSNKKMYSNSELKKPVLAPSSLKLNIPLVKKVSEYVNEAEHSIGGHIHSKNKQYIPLYSNKGKVENSFSQQVNSESVLPPVINFDGIENSKQLPKTNRNESRFKTIEYFNHLQSKQNYLNGKRNKKTEGEIADNLGSPGPPDALAVKNILFPEVSDQQLSHSKPTAIENKCPAIKTKSKGNNWKDFPRIPASILARSKPDFGVGHPAKGIMPKISANFPGLEHDKTLLYIEPLKQEEASDIKVIDSKVIIPKTYDPKSCFQLPPHSVLRVNVPLIGSDTFSNVQNLTLPAAAVRRVDTSEVVEKSGVIGTKVVAKGRERPIMKAKKVGMQGVKRLPFAVDVLSSTNKINKAQQKQKANDEKSSKNKNGNEDDSLPADKDRFNEDSLRTNKEVVTMVSLTRDCLSS